ncbi:hypothetical protein QVD17_02311 [Tagetes erecta]|uniref:BFN domain-containing protein n=1 Tax=Tagetes erecta TaxID=13708 RepID=A0AAD8P2A1_TARER|nr:hypothetical protein QVD17_02311 [Tagetes erecta]
MACNTLLHFVVVLNYLGSLCELSPGIVFFFLLACVYHPRLLQRSASFPVLHARSFAAPSSERFSIGATLNGLKPQLFIYCDTFILKTKFDLKCPTPKISINVCFNSSQSQIIFVALSQSPIVSLLFQLKPSFNPWLLDVVQLQALFPLSFLHLISFDRSRKLFLPIFIIILLFSGMMNYLQGPVVCPSVHQKQGGVPAVNGSLRKAKTLRSGMWGFRGVYSHSVRNHCQPKSNTITCTFSSSSNGNGSMAESFNENDSDYVDSTVVEAVEVKSSPEGFMIKMRDGKHLRCAHNNPQGGHLPDYAPHPAIVLKMEDETGLLLPIIVLEMPSVLLMAAIRNVQIARPTMYQVVREMVDKMGYKVKLVRVTKRIHEAYFARLYLTKVDDETECISFDLRPSDAINIAVRCKVPIQVNKFLAHSDGMKIVESAKPSVQVSSSDGLIFKELDRPSGQSCVETKEFNLVRNMLIAAVEERYKDAAQWRDKLTQLRSKKNHA